MPWYSCLLFFDRASCSPLLLLHTDRQIQVHFAALKAVGESAQKPLEYYENNICGALSLFRVMQEVKCKRIVFSSSATVYGQTAGSEKLLESNPISATNPYGRTKVFTCLFVLVGHIHAPLHSRVRNA